MLESVNWSVKKAETNTSRLIQLLLLSKVMKVKTKSTATIYYIRRQEFGRSRCFHLVREWSGHDRGYRRGHKIKNRLSKRGALVMLNKIWMDRTISQNTTQSLELYIPMSSLFVCEIWKTTISCVKKFQTIVNGYMRKILRIPWTGERVTNEVVWERTGQIPAVNEVG